MDRWTLRRMIPTAYNAVSVIDRATAHRDPEAGGTPAARFQGDLDILHTSLRQAVAQVAEGHRGEAWTEDDIRDYAIAAIDTGKQVLWDIFAHYSRVARAHLAHAVSSYVQGSDQSDRWPPV